MKKKWAEIQKIAERNALFLDQQPEDFLDSDVRLAEKDLLLLLWLLIDDLETEDGQIKKSTKNFYMVNRIDQLFNDFALAGGAVLIGKLISRFQKVISYNKSYYFNLLGTSEKFTSTKNLISQLFRRRIGLTPEGEMVKEGYVSSLLFDTSVRNQARETVYKGVLSGSKPSDLRVTVNDLIVGADKKKGALHKFYSTFVYDTFGQIDRMASAKFAENFKLQWFVYYGTLIKTSRDFCIKHINGIYNTEEAKMWIYENPSPIGVSAVTYDPVLDMGGIRCRHTAVFITEEMKEDLFNRGYTKAPSNLI